ncbi:MAG: 2,3-bisphosphoglycerate-independent phosphoglycerate mutase [Nitrospirae bacterium]|nr:2,3-bisphosphoglycerate-independent phosphoglycerate mutase [Nitrospirota bacterium]
MQKLIRNLIQKNDTKIIMVVLDGIGGLPVNGKTELETAATPNLDALANASACGLHIPIAHGITPGSGPGHLGIFGYNPVEHQIGRGILEALGLGLEISKADVCLRCNYASIKNGLITDRRAGRIPTEQSRKITMRLQNEIREIDGVEVTFAPGMEHRFAVRLRFKHPLPEDAAMIGDTDPQKEGKQPIPLQPGSENAKAVSTIALKLLERATDLLKNEEKANFLLMRGFSIMPNLPTFDESFGLKALAIAVYPMYRGLAKIVGMDTPVIDGGVEEEITFLNQRYSEYDFFFLHVKKIDSYGEDGNFGGKVSQIEAFDNLLPQILALNPDVLIITGDHSTPAVMKGHSWHPVPVLLKSPYVLGGICSAFSERECTKGELGILPAVNLLPLALANSLRLKKFGA